MTEKTATLPIRYVGKKDQRSDTVAGTGLTWVGAGDIQRVPLEAVPRLLRHPDVWELVDDGAPEAPPAPPAPPAGNGPGFFGTDHPDPVEIAGQKVGLGELIHAAAGKRSAEEWNALTDEERHQAVEAEIARRSAPPPAAKTPNKGGRPPGSKNKAKAAA